MNYKGLHINLAEVAMVITALGAFLAAWRGGKAAKDSRKGKEAEKGEADGTENHDGH
jgi:hypothetical protein